MPIPVTITLNSIVGTPGPFSLYSNTDGYTIPFETGVLLTSLQSGYGTPNVPNGTTNVKIKSTGGGCDYEITKLIVGIPTNTPTPTPTPTGPTNTPTSTPTPTPTSTPTPTTTSTITPTPTSLPGYCYTYRIEVSPSISPVIGNESQYGIRYRRPEDVDSVDNALSLFIAGDEIVAGITYKTYSICSNVEPTFLISMITPTSGSPLGSIPSGVSRVGGIVTCLSNIECQGLTPN
jgi:hypothetical protein